MPSPFVVLARHGVDGPERIDVTNEGHSNKEFPMAMNTVIYPVKDVDGAKRLFNSLFGVDPIADQPYYVGWRIDGQDIGLDPNGFAKGMTGPVAYFEVADIAATVDGLVSAGGKVTQAPADVGGGKLIATVSGADGNVIGLSQTPQGN
jgi:predicted enzyme related to lactoylglutathione lyase